MAYGDNISRKAAIDDIRTMNPKDAQLDIKWVEMWLKQLPPAQPEPCEDAVSRKAVQDTIHKWCGDCVDCETIAYEVITKIPPVTPKQRTGYWYPVGVVEVVGGESAMWGSAVAYHKCSECDEQALRDDFEQEVLSKWCPHCGAKMEGASE